MAQRVVELVDGLAGRLGVPRFVAVCTDLLGGADREDHVDELCALSGHDREAVLDRERWHDYWVRTWGARGLLHVWDDAATDAVVAGLGDEHYRPAEMCLKVAARHEVAGTGAGAARLLGHELPRVREQALRCLQVNGDVEHLDAVREALADPDERVRVRAARVLESMRERLDR